jgi:hypothetical protein
MNMRNLIPLGGLFAALSISFACHAGDIEVSGAWTRATAPGQDQAGVDLSITSKQKAALVGASTPAAKTVELHSMTSENGMMTMREVKTIELPAGKTVSLGKSGYHLMLNGLKSPLKEGATLPLTLNIKVANKPVSKVKTEVEVRSLTATRPASDGDDHMHM